MSLNACFREGGIEGVRGLPYLALFNAYTPTDPHPPSRAVRVLAFLRRSASSDRKFEAEAIALIQRPEWRANLVGGYASLFAPDPEPMVDALWGRVEGGSWASPQLACFLERLDDRFVEHAKAMQEKLVRAGISEPEAVTPDSHSRRGPETPTESAEKTVGALKYLIDLNEKGEARVPPYGPGTEHQREGWTIAWGSRTKVLDLLAELGQLGPPP